MAIQAWKSNFGNFWYLLDWYDFNLTALRCPQKHSRNSSKWFQAWILHPWPVFGSLSKLACKPFLGIAIPVKDVMVSWTFYLWIVSVTVIPDTPNFLPDVRNPLPLIYSIFNISVMCLNESLNLILICIQRNWVKLGYFLIIEA